MSFKTIRNQAFLKSSSTQYMARIFLAALLFSGVFSACTPLIDATRSSPIEEDYTKRTPGAVVDDEFIETKAAVNIKKVDSRFRNAQVKVNSYNGVVLLTGIVPETSMRDIATNTVSKIRKVRRVHNELYESPPRGFAARLADSWLSRKIKTRLMFNRSIPSSRFKVVTHSGTVYLMGLSSESLADNVVAAVKKVGGVQKIVRVFEYVDSYEPGVLDGAAN